MEAHALVKFTYNLFEFTGKIILSSLRTSLNGFPRWFFFYSYFKIFDTYFNGPNSNTFQDTARSKHFNNLESISGSVMLTTLHPVILKQAFLYNNDIALLLAYLSLPIAIVIEII